MEASAATNWSRGKKGQGFLRKHLLDWHCCGVAGWWPLTRSLHVCTCALNCGWEGTETWVPRLWDRCLPLNSNKTLKILESGEFEFSVKFGQQENRETTELDSGQLRNFASFGHGSFWGWVFSRFLPVKRHWSEMPLKCAAICPLNSRQMPIRVCCE